MELITITGSSVTLGLGPAIGQQPLRQGLLQGSVYSAEIFAKVVDDFLSPAMSCWNLQEPTWIQYAGVGLYALIYADEIMLLARSLSH